ASARPHPPGPQAPPTRLSHPVSAPSSAPCASWSALSRRRCWATPVGLIPPFWPWCCGRSWGGIGWWRPLGGAPPTREPSGGRRAGVRPPLAEVGMTKAGIRAASRELGLPTWDAPAAPCLASRVAYGLEITPRRLEQVERAEAYLRELGIAGDVRVRHLGDRARIEVEPAWIPWLRERLGAIPRRLGDLGFAAVEVDPRGYRRGSLILERAGRA